jgi:hypothetical protein
MLYTRKDIREINKAFEGVALHIDLVEKDVKKQILELTKVLLETFKMIGKDMTEIESRVVVLEPKKKKVEKKIIKQKKQ